MTTLLPRRYPTHLHRPHVRAATSVDPSLVQATWAASQQVDDPISRPRGGWSVSDWATTTRPLVDDGEVIGLAAVHAARGDAVAETRLALLPDRRTRGAARSLVDTALRMAREADTERLRLVVPRAGLRASDAARRAGFESVRETYVMLRPMSAGSPAVPAVPSVRVRPIRAGEEPALLAALNRACRDRRDRRLWPLRHLAPRRHPLSRAGTHSSSPEAPRFLARGAVAPINAGKRVAGSPGPERQGPRVAYGLQIDRRDELNCDPRRLARQ